MLEIYNILANLVFINFRKEYLALKDKAAVPFPVCSKKKGVELSTVPPEFSVPKRL